MRWISLIVLSLAFAATAADDLAGKYTAFGEDPRTRAYYSYDVEITPQGDVYKVTWYWEGGALYDGVGVVLNGLLCVGYAGPVGYGVSVYKIEPDGALKGFSALPGNPGKGWENLHPKESGAGGAADD
jgi:hypothetical protein